MYKKYEMELAGRTLRVDVGRVAKQGSLKNISDSRSAALKLRSLQIFYLPVFYCHENNHCLLVPISFQNTLTTG